MGELAGKFRPDGTPKPFPGCSLACILDSLMPQHALLGWVQQVARGEFFGSRLRFLPHETFHVTIFDLLCDQRRTADRWSSKVPLSSPLHQAEALLSLWLDDVQPPRRMRFRFGGLGPVQTRLQLLLDPADQATRRALASFRAAASEATGIRHERHDDYRCHVTLAYLLQPLSRQDKQDFLHFTAEIEQRLEATFGQLRLGPPQLVRFDDMLDFAQPGRRSDQLH